MTRKIKDFRVKWDRAGFHRKPAESRPVAGEEQEEFLCLRRGYLDEIETAWSV